MLSLRKIIRRILFESIDTKHVIDRTSERLLNQADIRPKFPESLYEVVIDRVNWIRSNVEFNPKKSYQVHIANLPNFFQHWELGKDEASSQGDMVYILVRKGALISIFFRRKPQRGRLMIGVDEETSYDYLKNQSTKDGGKVYFDKSVESQGKGQRKKISLDMPTVNLSGKNYFIDEPNEQVIYTKNIERTITFDDVLNTFPEEEAMKIFDQDYWSWDN